MGGFVLKIQCVYTVCLGVLFFCHTFISLKEGLKKGKHHSMGNQIPNQVIISCLFTCLLMSNIMTWKFCVSHSNPIYSNLRPLLMPHFPRWLVPTLPCLLERVVILHQRRNECIETLDLFLQSVHLKKGASLYRLTTCRSY